VALRKQYRLISALLVCLPAVVLAALIVGYSVDVPFWDQWASIGLVASAHNGTLAFRDLLSQQNESRLFFPRVLFIAIHSIAHGNVKYEIWAMFLIALVVMWNIWRLASLTIPAGPARMVSLALASLLIFSPIQWQNWLWGVQVICFLPVFCLTTAVVVCYSRLGAWTKLALSAVLAFIASFSYANGMICWVPLLPLVLMQFRGPSDRWKAAVAWFVLMASTLALYFRGYIWQSSQGHLSDVFKFPLKALQCFLGFLGAPLGIGNEPGDLMIADVVGAVVLLLAVVVTVKLLRGWKEASAGWLVIAAYSLASAVITTAGRVSLASMFLLDSRYTTFSLYLMVGLVFLLPMIFRVPRWSAAVAVSLFLVLHVVTFRAAVDQMRVLREDRLQSKACLSFLDLIEDSCQTQRLDWDRVTLKNRANALDAIGYLHPALVKSLDLRRIAGASSKQFGELESVVSIGGGFYRASGWAALPGRSEPADAVLLSYVRGDNEPVLFAIIDAFGERWRWEQWFELPAGADRIQAWGYDALEGRAYLLSGDRSASSATALKVQFKAGGGGVFENLAPGPVFTASGWAVLQQKHKPPDRVLLTCGAAHQVVASGAPSLERPDVARVLNDSGLLRSGWRISIAADRLTPECEMEAWAFDQEAGEAGLLSPAHRVP